MINFCHISPAPMLDIFCANQTSFLTLAHLLEDNQQYRDWFYNRPKGPNDLIIQDNSAFEQFKRGEPMFPADRLLNLASKYKPDYIVMSDYPGEHSSKTIRAAEQLAPQFKQAGFGTFFVPQSRIGDFEDYLECFAWAAASPLVDYIGVSILGVPNAYGVEQGNNLQRFLSRWAMMKELRDRGILDIVKKTGTKIHFLGMLDGPQEIDLVKDFHIDSWDSSAAIWAGLNDICFDETPTGLINGKFEKEVDFSYNTMDPIAIGKAKFNMAVVEGLIA